MEGSVPEVSVPAEEVLAEVDIPIVRSMQLKNYQVFFLFIESKTKVLAIMIELTWF